MTRERRVSDEQLGQLARRQSDLFRRVRDGTLPFDGVMYSLQSLLENRSDRFEWVAVTPVEYTTTDSAFLTVANSLDAAPWMEFDAGPSLVRDYLSNVRVWSDSRKKVSMRIYGVRFQYRYERLGYTPCPSEVEGDHFRHVWRPAFAHELIGYCVWHDANHHPMEVGTLVTTVSSLHRLRHPHWNRDAFLAVRKIAEEPGWKVTFVCYGGPLHIWFEEKGIVEDPVFLAVAP